MPAKPGATIESRAQAEQALARLADLDSQAKAITAVHDRVAAKLRDRFEAKKRPLLEQIDQLTTDLQLWAEDSPDEFPKPAKSIQMPHGKLGFRMGNRSLEPLEKLTMKDVLARLTGRFKKWIRIKKDVDARKILADSAGDKPKLKPEDLKTIGVKVVQEEKFYIELKS